MCSQPTRWADRLRTRHRGGFLAAALHACQTVIAQRQIAAKSNDIPAFLTVA
jgi:hypothetical protein